MVLGLTLNMNKIHIYGVDVEWSDVQRVANSNGCSCGRLPFTYCGLPIESSMSRMSTWNLLLKSLRSVLSSWKVKCLSAGGRLRCCLFFLR